MTLEDKIALCSGASFWETKKMEQYDIPALFLCDGPHGLRKQEHASDMLGVHKSREATCFPSEVTMADTWDQDLMQEVGKAVAEEAKAQNVDVVLGPGANIKRNPLCGRNFEYFSEDPYLAGKMAAGFIRGVEGEGICSSLKHFACNSQEYGRFQSNGVIDERTLRELYLSAFETAVKEGKPSTVMCAYPKINGIHCSDDETLLNGILRKEWGFSGTVVTDWGAMNDRIAGFRAGCDLNMPGGSAYMEKEVLQAVKNGTLPESDIDKSAYRILELISRAVETRKTAGSETFDLNSHNSLAAHAAEQGAVLLKNEDHILPLRKGTKAVLIGDMAKNLRFQGAGSSHINATRITSPFNAMTEFPHIQGCDRKGNTTDALLAEIRTKAKKAEAAIVFAGLTDSFESEGFDRGHMRLSEGHLRMIETTAEVNPNTIVILLCGSPVECPFADRVKAILYLGLPGQAGGEAIRNLLYGNVNPSGKLTESWPIRYEDCISSSWYGKTKDALYREGIYVGYRYYDKAEKPVRWPFGFGMSYTTFSYLKMEYSNGTVSVTIQNTGNRAGAEVVQLYVAAPQDGISRAKKELKGFQKICLEPQEIETISFSLDQRSFAVWNDGWKVPSGTYEILAGSDSQNLPLRAEVFMEGDPVQIPSWQKESWYETLSGVPTEHDLELATGVSYTAPVLKKGAYTMDNTVKEMMETSLLMKLIYRGIEESVAKRCGGKKDNENPEFRMLMSASADCPLRSMQISGGIKGGLLRGVLDVANGHPLRGILEMMKKD